MIIISYGWKMDVGDDVRDVICDNLCNFTSLLEVPIFSFVINCF